MKGIAGFRTILLLAACTPLVLHAQQRAKRNGDDVKMQHAQLGIDDDQKNNYQHHSS